MNNVLLNWNTYVLLNALNVGCVRAVKRVKLGIRTLVTFFFLRSTSAFTARYAVSIKQENPLYMKTDSCNYIFNAVNFHV